MKKISYAIILFTGLTQIMLHSAFAKKPKPNPTPTPTPTPVTQDIGVGTNFDSVGVPYGGCGVPAAQIDSSNYVALNVIQTPGDYRDLSAMGLSRPIPSSDASVIGQWNNGLNCGRWIAVTIGDFCTGPNSGAPGNGGFCIGYQWIADQYNGATLNMVVADSCTDGNEFCRDSFDHLDLHTPSLGQFSLNGKAVPNLITSGKWNNRQISWKFVSAPNYTGDILLGLGQNSQFYWMDLIITHLQNGIHKVEVMVNGKWQTAVMNSDMGQAYIMPSGADVPYKIRVYDANDHLINNGRIYTFSLPTTCQPQCNQTYTAIKYTTQ
jgi:hypothetical protein